MFSLLLSGLIDSPEMCLLSPFSSQNEADPSLPLLMSSSPGPNKSCCFQREPPEGCEKVRVWEETRYVCDASDQKLMGLLPSVCSELHQQRSSALMSFSKHFACLALHSNSIVRLMMYSFIKKVSISAAESEILSFFSPYIHYLYLV